METIIFIISVFIIFFMINLINHYLGLYFLSLAIEAMIRVYPTLFSFIILILIWVLLEKTLIYLESRRS